MLGIECSKYQDKIDADVGIQGVHMRNITGKFYEAPIYNDDLNREKAKTFDEEFCKS